MDNPYAAPSSNLGGQESFAPSSSVGPRTLDIMRRTRPWAMLCGILLLVTAGLTVIQIVSSGPSNLIANVIQIILNVYLGSTLLAYSSRIDLLLKSRKAADLERALDSHRSYWKVTGILWTLGIVFIGIALLGVIAAAGKLH